MATHEVPPPVQMVQLLAGFQLSQALYTVAVLGVPDRLGDGPRPVAPLADELDVNPRSLYRLLRTLASISVFTEPEPVWLAAAEFIVMNLSTRCPMPGLSKIVSLFMIIVTPAATIPTATKKIARRKMSPSNRRRIGTKIIAARMATAMTI